jgi:hypothetical protein
MLAVVILAALLAPAETPCTITADAVVITREPLDDSGGNAAALVTKPDDVAELVRLVACNAHARNHACGYDWIISFRRGDGSSRAFGHNEECEVYASRNAATRKLLRRYFDEVKREPHAFVFDVAVPAAIDPKGAAARLRSNEMTPFLFRGVDQRLPRIVIDVAATAEIPDDRARWEAATETTRAAARERLKAAFDELAKRYPGIRQESSDGGVNSMFGGGKIEEHARTTVLFPFGTSVRGISVANAEVVERVEPARSIVQVVAKTNSAKAVQAFAEERLGVNVSVAPYPSDP